MTDCSTILGQDQTEILGILFGSNLRTAFPHSQAVAAVSGSVSETLGVPELRSTIYILLRSAVSRQVSRQVSRKNKGQTGGWRALCGVEGSLLNIRNGNLGVPSLSRAQHEHAKSQNCCFHLLFEAQAAIAA